MSGEKKESKSYPVNHWLKPEDCDCPEHRKPTELNEFKEHESDAEKPQGYIHPAEIHFYSEYDIREFYKKYTIVAKDDIRKLGTLDMSTRQFIKKYYDPNYN